MKPIITFITILFISLLSSPSWSETLTIDDLVKTKGLYYKKFNDVPFTGEITGIESGEFKDGVRDGVWKIYHESGRLEIKGNFKDGKEEGLFEVYHQNGQLKEKGNFKDGEKDGLWELFNRDGTLERTDTYKDGNLVK
jgi:hypothetical protein